MINLFPITKVIAGVATIYACLVLFFAFLLNIGGLATFGVAIRGMAGLNLALFVIAAAGWRKLWRWFPKLDKWIYPDLNGVWDAEIRWNRGNRAGTKLAKAYIRQNLLKFSIELTSDESESETLLVVPHRDTNSARPSLYYLYRNVGIEGAAKKQEPHHGAAILKLDHESPRLLYGNYFTDRSTNGQFVLRRANEI